MNDISKWFSNNLDLSQQLQNDIVATIITIILLWLARKLILKLIFRQIEDVRVQYRWRKITTYVTTGIGFFLIGRIWFSGFQSISTFLGILSAGLAIALQDLIINMAGWAFILSRRPFKVGDRIQIGETRGDVIDQRIFMFTLMEVGNWVDAEQSTGRIIHIPNGKIFKEPLANYNEGFEYLWNEIPVLITFESDWKKAKTILLDIAHKHAAHLSGAAEQKIKQAARKFMIFYNKLTPIVYTSVRDSGVLLTIRFLCEPRYRRTREQSIWEDILDEFSKHVDIDFAYPTQRFFNHHQEGKIAQSGTTDSTNPEQKKEE